MGLKEIWNKMSGLEKGLTVGVPLIIAGGVAYKMTRPKPEEAAAGTTPLPPGGTPTPPVPVVEATYSLAPAVALHPALLPVLRPVMGSAAGSNYWILGDEAAAPFSTTFGAGVDALQGNKLAQPISSAEAGATTTFISDFGAQVAGPTSTTGMPGHAGGDGKPLDPADVWLIILGPSEKSVPVGATTQSIQQIRQAIPNQRILWVLAKSVPGEIAKAIGDAREEWFRSSSDLTDIIADEAVKAATAGSIEEIATAFPPPGAAGAAPPTPTTNATPPEPQANG